MVKNLFDWLHRYNAKRELQEIIPKLNTAASGKNAEQLVDLIFSSEWQRFFWLKQIKSEIRELCKIIENRTPETVLEIGTASGGSLFLFAKLSNANAHIISIDLPGGLFGGGYPAFKSTFYKSFSAKNQKITLLRENSHDLKTRDKIVETLNGKSIDYLFIDGDHSYEGVRKDFTLYRPLMSPKSIIAFHDIAEHPEDWNIGVKRFWADAKKNHRYDEFIERPNQGWAGIGVLYLNEEDD